MSAELPPGPRLPRLLTALIFMVQGHPWMLRYLERCHRRFPGAFTVRGLGDIVVISDPRAVRDMFRTDVNRLHAGEANGILRPLVGDSVITMDGPAMLERKRLVIEPLYDPRFLDLARTTIAELTREAVATWPRGQVFALRSRLQDLTLEIIVRLVFGADRGEQADLLRARLLHLLRVCDPPYRLMLFWPDVYQGRGVWSRLVGPTVRRWANERRGPWGRFLRARDAVDEAIHALIDSREAEPDPDARADILSLLIHNRRGTTLGREELRNELMTFLLAGHETTASALAWLFDLLLHDRAALDRVRAELDAPERPYLQAAIKETLRLRPPIREMGRVVVDPYPLHTSGAAGGCDCVIPPVTSSNRGVCLMASAWLIHHDARHHPDPERFDPERYLGARPDQLLWIPFGGGQRQCLGYRFAPFEMEQVAVAILREVSLASASARLEPVVERRVTLEPARGVRVRIT